MSLAELPRPNREPGFYLEHRVRDAHTQALFIEMVREGMDKSQAAREAGTTATKMKGLKRRDSAFRTLYEEANESYEEALQDKIRCQWHERAFNKDDPHAQKFLEKLIEAHLPEMAYKHSRHITHDNPLDVRVWPGVDPALVDATPIEEREAMLEWMRKVTKDERAPLRAIDAR